MNTQPSQAYHNPPPLGRFLNFFLYPACYDHSGIYQLVKCNTYAPSMMYLAIRCTQRPIIASFVASLCARIYALTPDRPPFQLTGKQTDKRHRADAMIQRLIDFQRLNAAQLHVEINWNTSSNMNLQHAINVLTDDRIAALITELLRQIASLERKPNLVAVLAMWGEQ
ncbi:MAG: hypothetical protein KF716_15055 [Anaerolineae bacterium]|nr:hypothetical protein [Anaerolineae bacterium]